jgi:ATP/ADP translocase
VKWGTTIRQLLNIRADESWLVSQLFFLQFFQGAGVALFFTVANALFLEKYPIHELPVVYLMAAAMLWVTGYLYTKLEHSLSIKNLVGTVITIMTISVGLFRLGIWAMPGGYFLYLMVAWYYILYLLGNLEFWGLSSLLFDIRQSKRLFGIISAGDIPAKIVGYSSASIIVHYTGSANMLYIAMGSLAISLIFWRNLAKAGKLNMEVKHEHHHHAQPKHGDEVSFTKLVSGFFGSNLILSVAILSFLVVTVSTLINFSFYAEVKERIHSDVELASFIGLFMASGRVVAIFVKLLMTGKLADTIGIKGSLLITPLVLLIAIFAVTLSPSLSRDSSIILYVFGVMAILSETLKAALQDPVFIAVMQPLKTSLRLRGHTIVKGIMDPFALAFGSIIIFSVMRVSEEGVNLHLLSYILIVLITIWIVFVFIVDRNYLKSLVDGLHNRYIVGREIDLSKEETTQLLADKIPTAPTGEAIYLLQLAAKLPDEKKQALILTGLKHPKEEVKIEAIKLIEQERISSALPILQQIHVSNPTEALLAQTIQAICIIQQEEDVEDFSAYLENKDLAVVRASVIGLLKNGTINAIVAAGQKMQQLRGSTVAEERAIAAEVIGALKVKSFYKSLLMLLHDDSRQVVSAAIEASGKLQSEKLVRAFIDKIEIPALERRVLSALLDSGTAALPALRDLILSPNVNRNVRLRLFQTVAQIGGPLAQQILLDCLHQFSGWRVDIYHALHLCGFRAKGELQKEFEKRIESDINFGIHLLYQIHWLQENKENRSLEGALQLELRQTQTRLLWLFSFVYDREKIMRAKNGFQVNKKESIANAQEIIDLTVPKEIASKFNTLFEQSSVAERMSQLKVHVMYAVVSMDDLSKDILESEEFHYNHWTRAVVMHTMSVNAVINSRKAILTYRSSTEQLLQETSTNALKKIAAAI